MKVSTKYGQGTLIGVSYADGTFTYKVLIDWVELPGKVEDRVYNCRNVTVLSEEGSALNFKLELL